MDWSRATIVLASTSPRRRELLTKAGVPHHVVSPELDDADLHMGPVPLRQWVASLAYLKARAGVSAWKRAGNVVTPGAVFIGADTLVDQDGQVLSKAMDAEDAERMIKLMQGREHEVLTGVALLDPITGRRDVFVDRASVKVGWIGNERIAEYVKTNDWAGKAGAYNYDDRLAANWPLSTIDDPACITGLPIRVLLPRLVKFTGFALGKSAMGIQL